MGIRTRQHSDLSRLGLELSGYERSLEANLASRSGA